MLNIVANTNPDMISNGQWMLAMNLITISSFIIYNIKELYMHLKNRFYVINKYITPLDHKTFLMIYFLY